MSSLGSVNHRVVCWFVVIALGIGMSGPLVAQSSGHWVNAPATLNVQTVNGAIVGPGIINDMVSWNGGVVVAGSFNRAGGVTCQNVAWWSPANGWQRLGDDIRGIFQCLVVHNGTLYGAGGFRRIFSESESGGLGLEYEVRSALAHYDAIHGEWVYIGTDDTCGEVRDMVSFAGAIWLGGRIGPVENGFDAYAGGLLIYNNGWRKPDVDLLESTHGDGQHYIADIEVWDPDGAGSAFARELYCAGDFVGVEIPATIDNDAIPIPDTRCIFRYNVSTEALNSVAGGLTAPVTEGELLTWGISTIECLTSVGTTMFLGGRFSFFGPAAFPAENIATLSKVSGTTLAWGAIGSGADAPVVTSVAFSAGGTSMVAFAGEFQSVNGVAANMIALWTGTSIEPLSGGIGVNTTSVHDLLTLNGALWVGGYFDGVYQGTTLIESNSLAIWVP